MLFESQNGVQSFLDRLKLGQETQVTLTLQTFVEAVHLGVLLRVHLDCLDHMAEKFLRLRAFFERSQRQQEHSGQGHAGLRRNFGLEVGNKLFYAVQVHLAVHPQVVRHLAVDRVAAVAGLRGQARGR